MQTISTPWLLTAALALGSAAFGAAPPDLPAATTEQDAAAHFAALEADFQAAVHAAAQAQSKAIKAAIDSGAKTIPAMRMGPPPAVVAEYMPKFQAGAKAFAGKDGAIPFLLWVVRSAAATEDKASVEAALATLTGAHIKSPALRPVPAAIAAAAGTIGDEAAEAMLRKIEVSSTDPDVQALAIFARVVPTIANSAVTSGEYQAARKEALRAMEVAKDVGIDAEIQSAIDGREKLVDGGVAPDIIGVDLDGVPFKLSDYRGKIVMLDFWGDW